MLCAEGPFRAAIFSFETKEKIKTPAIDTGLCYLNKELALAEALLVHER